MKKKKKLTLDLAHHMVVEVWADRIGYMQQASLKQQLEAYLDMGTDLGMERGSLAEGQRQ
jgi:hypothetical protein